MIDDLKLLAVKAVLLIAVTVGLAFFAGRCEGRRSAQDTVSRRAVRMAHHERAAAVETVTVHVREVVQAKAESDRLGELVKVVAPGSISVRVTPAAEPQLVQVPRSVTAKMQADSVTIVRQAAQIGRLETLVRADSNVIQKQAVRIGELEGRRCGAKCGALLGGGSVLLIVFAVK